MKEIVLNSKNFDSEVNKAEMLVLVDFYATWCGPCQMLAPVISEIAKEYAGKVKVCKVNVDDEQELALKYGVMSIPTLVFIDKGKVVKVSVGYLSKEELISVIDGLL